MTSTVDDPPQAQRLGTVADATVAGPGATDKYQGGNLLSEKPANGASEASSDAAEHNGGDKPLETPQTPERSKGKVALIMGSLMVFVIIFSTRLEQDTDGGSRLLSSLLLSIR